MSPKPTFNASHAHLAAYAAAMRTALGPEPQRFKNVIVVSAEWRAWTRAQASLDTMLVDDFAAWLVAFFEDHEQRHGWLWAVLDHCPHVADEEAAEDAAADHAARGGDLWHWLQGGGGAAMKRRAAILVARGLRDELGDNHPLVAAIAGMAP